MLVNLKKRVKAGGKWTFMKVPRKSGRFQPEKVAEPGTFYIEWRQDGKRHQESVGESHRGAVEALRTKQDELDAQQGGKPKSRSNDTTLEEARTRFLRDVRATKSAGTHNLYSIQSNWVLARLPNKGVMDITAGDVMGLFAKGRDEGAAQTTINLRASIALGIVRHAGNDVRLKKGSWPKVPTTDPEVYLKEDLVKFFSTCNERDRLLFGVYLHTGFRNMEVATLTWTGDVDWDNNALRVRPKPDLKFQPKTYEWRAVKVPKELMKQLAGWKHSAKSDRLRANNDLVFPSGLHKKRPDFGGKVDQRMLERCKEIAYKAGLNCNRCANKPGACIDGPRCSQWFLHKFRHTFATNMLRSGVDIRSLQTLLGHKTLATTEKYLRSLRLQDLEQKIENSVMADLI